jgi:hypothetical protein
MIAAPMPTPPDALRRPPGWLATVALLALTLAAGGCASSTPTPTPSVAPSASLGPTPTPAPTPLPTLSYTNPPNPALTALIPTRIAGAAVSIPPTADFGLTPGDFGSVFGDLGLRFDALALAYVLKPRMSLYAVHVSGAPVDTNELRPYLAAAGEYVGVAGIHPEAWKAAVVNGKRVWTRGEDVATLAGTTFYCWSAPQYVFLLLGSSDAANRAMVAALPGQPAPTPTPRASGSPSSPTVHGSPSASPSASGG